MDKHTQTPIEVRQFTHTRRNESGFIECHDCVELDTRQADGSYLIIAQLYPFLDTAPEYAEQVMANAHLLSQAHNLLDVARDAYALLADPCHQWPGRATVEGQALLCGLRDTIALATDTDPLQERGVHRC